MFVSLKGSFLFIFFLHKQLASSSPLTTALYPTTIFSPIILPRVTVVFSAAQALFFLLIQNYVFYLGLLPFLLFDNLILCQ